ncbi:MAG: hypothetical protein JNM18_05785 [Planctomycetaceae bacterium]|nr:hypothetical protein [Planctomycetaceae bacterium]
MAHEQIKWHQYRKRDALPDRSMICYTSCKGKFNSFASPWNTTMTQLLEQALAAVKQLPAIEQDAIATLILEELADEQRWQAKFEKSSDALAKLAAKARADIQAGRVQRGGFDQL